MASNLDPARSSSAVVTNADPICHIGRLPPAVLYPIAQYAARSETTKKDYDAVPGHRRDIQNPVKSKSMSLLSRHSSTALSQTCQLFRKFGECFFEDRLFTCRKFEVIGKKTIARVFLSEDSGFQLVQVPPMLWSNIQKLNVTTSTISERQYSWIRTNNIHLAKIPPNSEFKSPAAPES